MVRSNLIVLICLMTFGCHSYESRIYDITVHNISADTVTLWLTKDGEPFENGWLSPEELAVNSPKNKDYVVSGVIVVPGKTASTGPRKGEFEKDTQAILRVYDGQLMFNQILAVGRDSPLRIDMPLAPGSSSWEIVRNNEGMIHIRPAAVQE